MFPPFSHQPDHLMCVCASDRVRLVVGVHLLAVESNRCCRLHQLLPGSDRGASDYIK